MAPARDEAARTDGAAPHHSPQACCRIVPWKSLMRVLAMIPDGRVLSSPSSASKEPPRRRRSSPSSSSSSSAISADTPNELMAPSVRPLASRCEMRISVARSPKTASRYCATSTSSWQKSQNVPDVNAAAAAAAPECFATARRPSRVFASKVASSGARLPSVLAQAAETCLSMFAKAFSACLPDLVAYISKTKSRASLISVSATSASTAKTSAASMVSSRGDVSMASCATSVIEGVASLGAAPGSSEFVFTTVMIALRNMPRSASGFCGFGPLGGRLGLSESPSGRPAKRAKWSDASDTRWPKTSSNMANVRRGGDCSTSRQMLCDSWMCCSSWAVYSANRSGRGGLHADAPIATAL
mmetsp:Transcript_11860/g.41943  ORF Transcript_11860/g.41943 Transcript_11860/m.41943 type:complete len:357 (-) Transcript_11860:9-1079(-)